jgi:extracellular factor (EF) 3-hydroxypalmitic acid methyl ester biosynthesis protein
LFLEDPYTRRGLEKPRGYAGDAVLLDFIYGTAPLPDNTTRTGLRIHKWMSEQSQAFHAVRARRALSARYIDDAISKNPRARILSIACGHLREFSLCKFDSSLWEGELLAIDQDPLSLEVVSNTHSCTHVKPVHIPIAKLLNGTAKLGKFDLIYSMGLLDYLSDELVHALVSWSTESLNPEGVLLFANFQQCAERGFMESVMRWSLTYRTSNELSRFMNPSAGTIQSFEDKHKIIAFATLTKQAPRA